MPTATPELFPGVAVRFEASAASAAVRRRDLQWVGEDEFSGGLLRGLQAFIAGLLRSDECLARFGAEVVMVDEGNFEAAIAAATARSGGMLLLVTTDRMAPAGGNKWVASWKVEVFEEVVPNRSRSGHAVASQAAEAVAARLWNEQPNVGGWTNLRLSSIQYQDFQSGVLVWSVDGNCSTILTTKG